MSTRTPIRRRSVPRRAAVRYPDLATYIEETGDTEAAIAEAVGVSQAHISRIRNGHVIPRSRLAVRIAKHAQIPLDSFTRVYLAKHAAEVA